MDIVLLIILYLLQNYFPILGEIYLVIGIFGLLGVVWALEVILIAIGTVIIALMLLPRIYDRIVGLSVYHNIINENIINKDSESSEFGEYYDDKTRKVLLSNLIVGLYLFLTLIYVLNTVPSTFLNSPVNQTFSLHLSLIQTPKVPIQQPTAAFDLTLMLVPAFLLGLRVFANPTPIAVRLFIPSLNNKNFSEKELRYRVRVFKGEVISYFYSFIIGTAILFVFTFELSGIITQYDVITWFSPFKPEMDILSIIFFIVVEILIITCSTLLCEWYLKEAKPIDGI